MDQTALMSSHVLSTPAASCDEAYAFFQRKLRYETDPCGVLLGPGLQWRDQGRHEVECPRLYSEGDDWRDRVLGRA